MDKIECKEPWEMNHSEFSLYISEHDLKPIIEYDDFEIYQVYYDFFYYSADEFYELDIIASLSYDVNNDIKVKDGLELSKLFDCDCCGECVEDDDIYYLWFKIVPNNDISDGKER